VSKVQLPEATDRHDRRPLLHEFRRRDDLPTTLSLISNVYTERAERAKAIGLWDATAGIAIALGPIVGAARQRHERQRPPRRTRERRPHRRLQRVLPRLQRRLLVAAGVQPVAAIATLLLLPAPPATRLTLALEPE
jgi:hypothetical protein